MARVVPLLSSTLAMALDDLVLTRFVPPGVTSAIPGREKVL